MLTALFYSNPDYSIAKYNIDQYMNNKTKTLDVYLLMDLNDAAIPLLCEIYDTEPNIITGSRISLLEYLRNKKNYGFINKNFKTFNYQSWQAKQALDKRYFPNDYSYD